MFFYPCLIIASSLAFQDLLLTDLSPRYGLDFPVSTHFWQNQMVAGPSEYAACWVQTLSLSLGPMPLAAGSARSPASAQSSQGLLLREPGRLSCAGDGALQPGAALRALPVSWGFTCSPPATPCRSCGPSSAELKTGHILAPRWWLLAPRHSQGFVGSPRRVPELALALAPLGLRVSHTAQPGPQSTSWPSSRGRCLRAGKEAASWLWPPPRSQPRSPGTPRVQAHTRSLLPSFEGSQKVAGRFSVTNPPAFTGRVTGSLFASRQVS